MFESKNIPQIHPLSPYKASLYPLPALPALPETYISYPPIPIIPNAYSPIPNAYKTQNPCTKLTTLDKASYGETKRYEREKKRFKQRIMRPMINKINPNTKKWKSPIEIAKEFAEIEQILRGDNVSLQKRKENISQIQAILKPKLTTEAVELFGKKIQINRKSSNKTTENMHKIMRKKTKSSDSNTIRNIKYKITQQNWNKLSNKFNHEMYCKTNNIKLECNDQYYYFNESNDYELMKKLKKNNYKRIATIISTKENKLFTNILSENGNAKYNQLSNYKFLRHTFPSFECMDCGSMLMVIPLSSIGEGYIANDKSNKMVHLYKICAICKNYPNCQFPLYRHTYLKYWVRSAYFEIIETIDTTVVTNSKIQSMVKVNKKRKLNDNTTQNVNSYNYLQSLSI